MSNVKGFLYQQIGYGRIESLINKRTIALPYLREFLEGTVFASWPPQKRSSKDSSKDSSVLWPRIPKIKQKLRKEDCFSHRLLLNNFFFGYTPEGIDGLLNTSRRKYFPQASIEVPEGKFNESWRAMLRSPECEIEILGTNIFEEKYCSIDFILEDVQTEEINRIVMEYTLRMKVEQKKANVIENIL